MSSCRSLGSTRGVHYPTLTFAQPAIADDYRSEEAPMAAAIANEEVSLPIHPLITNEEILRVVERCRAWEALHG